MFYLDLLKEDGAKVTIRFKEAGHNLGQKWATALRNHIDTGNPVAQPHRIYNLNNSWTVEKIINELNVCIDNINNYKFIIDFKITDTIMTQDDSNRLHHFFEIMRGENDKPNEYYDNAPRPIKNYIDDFNILIHRWESFNLQSRIVVHMKNRPMLDLADEDYQYWTLNYRPGDIRLNYCHKGKPIWDLFKDGDTHINDDNIRPQRRYSPDFNVVFDNGPGETADYLYWWYEQGAKLNNLGYFKDDPKCAIGHAIIGKLVDDPMIVKDEITGIKEILCVRYDYT